METYNTSECNCDQDHDSLEHIIEAILTAPFAQALPTYVLAQTIAQAAKKVGWRKLDLDALEFTDQELSSLVAQSERSETDEKGTDA